MTRTKNSDKTATIAAVPLFQRLTRRQAQRVARHADETTLPAGSVLAREGETGRELLILVDGKARVQRGDRTIAQLGPGDVVGEMALLDGQPRSATVVADTDVTALVIHRREFGPLLDELPGFKDKIIVELVSRLRDADAILAD